MLKCIAGIAVSMLSVHALAQSSGFAFDRDEAAQIAAEYREEQRRQQTTRAAQTPPTVRPAERQQTQAQTRPTLPTQGAQRPSQVAAAAPTQRAPQQNVLDNFKCEDNSYTDQTADATELFRRAIGVRDMRPERFIVENSGFSGNRVIMKILKSDTIELDLVSHGAQISGQMCVRGEGSNRTLELEAKITGHGDFTIYISKRQGGMHLRGSGRLSAVLNFGYHLRDSKPAAGVQ